MGDKPIGQLGDGTATSSNTPVQVASGVASVAAGGYHSLFVKTDGSLWAMGDNWQGQLGDGTTTERNTPVQVASGVASVAAGAHHSLFVKTDGTLWAMGYNSNGQLGDGTFDLRTLPIRVGGITLSVMAIGPGPLAYQWKKNGVDIVGATSATYTVPNPLVTDGGSYSVVVTNSFGSTTSVAATLSVNVPPSITTHPVSQIVGSSGQNVTFTAAASGTSPLTYQWVKDGVEIWEATSASYQILSVQVSHAGNYSVRVRNVAGAALSDAATLTVNLPPSITVQPTAATANTLGTGSVVDSSGGSGHTLFLADDGSLWATGYNQSGQLGDGTSGNRMVPVQVATGVASMSAGASHSLFVKTDGTMWAMGSNDYGQLGDGTTTWRSTPVQVASGVAFLAAGSYHSLFVKTDGTIWAMGSNGTGQLGDGTTTDRSAPVQVATGVTSVAAGHAHSMFVKTNETLWTMGYNQ
jgi:alpha-tubulin suppressor-like RCC1 family protein